MSERPANLARAPNTTTVSSRAGRWLLLALHGPTRWRCEVSNLPNADIKGALPGEAGERKPESTTH